jgi:hypothetical protein
VVYLLGTLDNDPHHWGLDTSSLNHRLWEMPGVGHHADQMLGSTCGLAALYGRTPLGERCPR